MLRFVLMVLLATTSQAASATMYKWVDEKGDTHYSDTLPTQAVNKSTAELNKRGQVVRKTAAALTPEERKAYEAEEARKKDAERKELEQKRRDNALLDSYTSERDIDIARDRNLQSVQAQIDTAKVRIKSIQGRQESLRKQMDTITKSKRPVPPDLTAELRAAEDEIQHLWGSIEKHNEALTAIKTRFESDKQRYRELHSSQFAH